MRTHTASVHNLAYDEYVRQFGSAEVISVKFRCKMCLSEMKHSRQNIYAHMKDVHKLTIAEYEAQFPENEVVETVPNPIIIEDNNNKNAGLLDNGNTPSRWNR